MRPPGRQIPEQQQHPGEGEAERILCTRTQPNLVPLGRGREEGELSNPADHDSFLDHQDTAFMEQTLNVPDWRADPPGA
jgi:hypothetical protein